MLKPRNNGQWTEARYSQFIKSALRAASTRWGPKYEAKKRARVSRGIYLCIGYNRGSHQVPASLPPKAGNKRRRECAVDHIEPVVSIREGFRDWDTYIERLFVETSGYQLLCPDCHDTKTADERAERKMYKNEK